jgi:hypothetical protein
MFLGSEASYGYMKDPNDKHHLILNTETAQVVRRIFDYALSGMGIADIATILNNENIKTPYAYKNKKPTNKQINIYMWTNSSVNKILKNRVYTGDLVQNVQSKLNYKSKKKIKLDQSLWIIVENTHEAIVTREEFNIIQNSPSRKRKPIKTRKKLLFENLAFCKECGGALSIKFNKKQNSWSLNCNKYARSPRLRLCEPHFIPYKQFEKLVLERIKEVLKNHLRKINTEKIVNKIPKYDINRISNEKVLLKNKMEQLTIKMNALYDDKLNEIISVNTFMRMSDDIEEKLKKINQRLKEMEESIIKKKSPKMNYENIICKLVNIENPSRNLLFQIIKKIKVDKNKVIEINYNFKI